MTNENALLPEPQLQERLQRLRGNARSGEVDLRAFDEGIVRTLRAEIINDNYYLTNIRGVSPPPEFPGVPVTFAYPEDVLEKHFIPVVVVRRDDVSAAMNRWHPDGVSYRAPAEGAQPVEVTIFGTNETIRFWDRTETKRQPEPVDIMYTISIVARHRQGISGRREANEVFKYVLGAFNAYGVLLVEDDLGDPRTYEVFREGISMLDDLPEVSGRVIGFAVTLRVEAELDLRGPKEHRTVTTVPELGPTGTISMSQKVE